MSLPAGALAGIIIMGVSGAGKSTVGQALSRRTGYPMCDGDEFHPAANIAKMSSGQPLSDEDRMPWLTAIAAAIDAAGRDHAPVIIACSALRRSYRDLLVHGRDDVALVFLKAPREVIALRLAKRLDHFMPPSLLDSQFSTLEEPDPAEPVLTLDAGAPVETIVDHIIAALQIDTTRGAA